MMMKDLTRRKFIIASAIAAGFALASHPILAQAIQTDAEGLVEGLVQIPVSDGEIPAYRAMPETGENFPVVLVVQEIFGVHEHLQDICRRFAKLGYLAIAPELYARQGDVSQLTDIQEIIDRVVSQVPDAQVMSDLDAAVQWATDSGKADVAKLGITGFCWGGRIVWLYAAHNPSVKTGVAWYGKLVDTPSELKPKHPIDIAAELTVPILGLYAGSDSYIPNETVEQMREVLATGSSGSEIILYPDTPHGFFADYRETYRPELAQEAWMLLLDWFAKAGVGVAP
jgi:carboxymethylenebutenolidase